MTHCSPPCTPLADLPKKLDIMVVMKNIYQELFFSIDKFIMKIKSIMISLPLTLTEIAFHNFPIDDASFSVLISTCFEND